MKKEMYVMIADMVWVEGGGGGIIEVLNSTILRR